MSALKFTKKPINGSYVIAADTLDDTSPYSGNGDCFVYFNPMHGWGNISVAETYNNETLLAQALEKAIEDENTIEQGYTPFPVYLETVITTVNTESFKDYTLQLKRSRAMSKLTDEDMVVLGLAGGEK